MSCSHLEQRRLRLALVSAGARLAAAGLILPGEGNLSVRCGSGECLITPSGVDKGRLAAVDPLHLDIDFEGEVDGVSSEARMHCAIYRTRPEITAVVHAHPQKVLALAARRRVPDFHLLLESEALLGPVAEVRALPPGSDELAREVAATFAGGSACVMHRHGAVTAGAGLEEAMVRMLLLERLAALAEPAGP